MVIAASANGRADPLAPWTLAFPDDTTVYDTWNEYMFGGGILVAPVTTAGATKPFGLSAGSNWLNYNDKTTTVCRRDLR